MSKRLRLFGVLVVLNILAIGMLVGFSGAAFASPPDHAGSADNPVNAPPVNAPPADAPPVNAPPADAPPVDAPPANVPAPDVPPGLADRG